MKIRRFATADGTSGVLTRMDEVFDTATVKDSFHVFDIWGFDKTPQLPVTAGNVLEAYQSLGLSAPVGGLRVDVLTIPPSGDKPLDLASAMSGADMGAGGGGSMVLPEGGNGMHRTDTVDLITVLEGETNVAFPGEDGTEHEITIKAGDFVVYNGIMHRWHNRSDANCTILAVAIAAERAPES
jgi:uncharacterized RmlC-like cupin family protein